LENEHLEQFDRIGEAGERVQVYMYHRDNIDFTGKEEVPEGDWMKRVRGNG